MEHLLKANINLKQLPLVCCTCWKTPISCFEVSNVINFNQYCFFSILTIVEKIYIVSVTTCWKFYIYFIYLIIFNLSYLSHWPLRFSVNVLVKTNKSDFCFGFYPTLKNGFVETKYYTFIIEGKKKAKIKKSLFIFITFDFFSFWLTLLD